MTDPAAAAEHLFTDYAARMDEAQRRAEQVRQGLDAVHVTERSADGQLTVTVNASGNLTDLRIAPGDRQGAELAQAILHTMRRAQSKLADAVQNAVPATVSPAIMTELADQYRGTYPEPRPEPAQSPRRTLRLGAESEATAPPDAGAHQRRRRPAEPHDDGDYGDRGFLR